MVKKILTNALLLVFLSAGHAWALEIQGAALKYNLDQVHVTFSLDLGDERREEIRQGIPKVIIIYIELYRSWDMWPDEFIAGKKITTHLVSDPVKKEHIGRSFDGNAILEERFKSPESMMRWALSFKNLSTVRLNLLESGEYFMRITAESRLKKVPSVISDIFFFLPTREFKISKELGRFSWDKREKRVTVLNVK